MHVYWLQMLQSHLKGLDEGPQQCPDAFAPAQQFDQSHHSEQAEEGDWDASAVLRVLKWRVKSVKVQHQDTDDEKALYHMLIRAGSRTCILLNIVYMTHVSQ